MSWIKVAPIEKVLKSPLVLRHGSRQIAVFTRNDRVYAVDNRCPHEGYPLVDGSVTDDCVLTCNWHNWKFRLDTGECILGGDDVRSYSTKIEDGHAWVEVIDPPPEETRRRIVKGLKNAFEERDFGRICREIARLHYNRFDPMASVCAALEWAHDRLEFGTTHALAAVTDWLHVSRSLGDDFEFRLICLAEAVDHLAADALRRRQYPYSESGEPFRPESFLAAIEGEQTGRAEAMTARALADGMHWPDLEETFTAAALAHYNDFGHSLIYVVKTGELLGILGTEIEGFILLPLTRHLSYTTREDLLPEFAGYAGVVARLPEPVLSDGANVSLEVPFRSTIRQAFEWLESSMAKHDIQQVYDALLEALALNMLSFDVRYASAYDRPVSQNAGWLDFTHGITFANAVRQTCSRYPHLWKPALAQMACFLGRNTRYLDPQIDITEWFVDDPQRFFADARLRLLDHGYREPIYSAHLVKTSVAAETEWECTSSESCRRALLAALNRFLQSPIKTKHVRREARQAIHLVRRDFQN